jgi:xanthine dehydrogenase accessory factor
MRNIFGTLSISNNHVLATIVMASGSTPQKPGSSAVFNQSGLRSGTIGGGILEGKVQQLAADATTSKKSSLCHFNLDHDIFHPEDAICGGRASVLIDANPGIHFQVFDDLKQSLLKRIPGVMITMISGMNDLDVTINRYWVTDIKQVTLPIPYLENIVKETERLLNQGKDGACNLLDFSSFEENKTVLFFFETIYPLPQLIIAGAGHIGKALAKLGSLLNFEVTVIDDRIEFANAENIPEADHLIVNDIGHALKSVEITKDTFIVIVTRGHHDDEKALKPCIGSVAKYIGMIGSKHKVALMHDNFIKNGWATDEDWSKIHTPIGIKINSKTVWEIVISIAAELILIKNSEKK